MEKRAELHCHSKMSSMKGLCDLKELFSKAVKQGISGIAITDIDSVQAFGRIWFEINHLTGYKGHYRELFMMRLLPKGLYGKTMVISTS